jgi:hypothetical protein
MSLSGGVASTAATGGRAERKGEEEEMHSRAGATGGAVGEDPRVTPTTSSSTGR